jgi:hypothetical protein
MRNLKETQMARKRKKPDKIRTVVKNYGLMWRRSEVGWGRGGQRGELQGRRSNRVIDFREQIGVYVLYDEGRRPVYIGQAGQGNARLFNRLRTHTRDNLALRWQYFSWFGLLPVNKRGDLSGWDAPEKRVSGTLRSTLNEIEGVLIAATEPAFNKQGAKFKGISRYRQVRESTRQISLEDLHETMERFASKLDTLANVIRKRPKL